MKWWALLAGVGPQVPGLPDALALCLVTTHNKPDDDDKSAEGP
jgi:hypothetical protein